VTTEGFTPRGRPFKKMVTVPIKNRGKSLVINLPGSLRAVKECLETILPLVPHALDMIKGKGHENSALF